jgi:hypothetical protein
VSLNCFTLLNEIFFILNPKTPKPQEEKVNI